MLLFLISSLFVLINGVPLQLQPLKSFNATNLIAKLAEEGSAKNLIAKLADEGSAKNLIAKFADGGSAKNLIAELADADPAKVQEVITLVEAMIGVAQNDLNAFTVTSTDANAAYTAAVSTYDAAVVAHAEGAKTVATLQTAVTDALAAKNIAEGAKTGAQSSLDAEKSRLDAEVASLQQVVTILKGLSAPSGNSLAEKCAGITADMTQANIDYMVGENIQGHLDSTGVYCIFNAPNDPHNIKAWKNVALDPSTCQPVFDGYCDSTPADLYLDTSGWTHHQGKYLHELFYILLNVVGCESNKG